MKPLEVRVEERIKTQFSSDPTSAMFHATRIREEEKAKEKPLPAAGGVRGRITAWERSRRG
jgi:hypothetical protein